MRDLVEMSVVTMFLEGGAERDRDDWMDIALTYGQRPLRIATTLLPMKFC